MNETTEEHLSHEPKSLASQQFWNGKWSRAGVTRVSFNPYNPSFLDLHRLFQRTLPKNKDMRFLEIGCYPGSFLWYFHRYFGYKVSGLEYIGWCCEATRRLFHRTNCNVEIIHADLFEYSPENDVKLWDVVASFGLVEHFQNTQEVVQKHLDLLKPGGFLVIMIPNHHGMYGRLLKCFDPDAYAKHNLMTYADLLSAVEAGGNVTVLEGGYYSRMGLQNTEWTMLGERLGKYAFGILGLLVLLCGAVGQLLPNTPWLSPNAVIIGRKQKS